MLGKLAVRNVKRSARDYVIYLITIIISFSLIFALNLISTSEAVMEISQGLDTFQYIMYGINVIVLGVICFLIKCFFQRVYSWGLWHFSCLCQ